MLHLTKEHLWKCQKEIKSGKVTGMLDDHMRKSKQRGCDVYCNIYSQALQVSRICSFENDFIRHQNEMKSWYPKTLLDVEVNKTKFPNTSGDKKTKTNEIPLVITNHPLLKDLAKVIKKHLHLLQMNDEIKKAFTPGPMVSFWGARKLSSYLVRAKLYPLEKSVGSFKCNGKCCQVCINVTESNTFSCLVDKKACY